MSTPQETIQADVKEAMRAKDKERLSTLRMLLSAVKNEKIEKKSDLTEDEFLTVVKRLVKQRKDSAGQYRDAGREELAAKEEAEIEILESYLPKQASEEEIRSAIAAQIEAEGLEGPKAIGAIMRAMMQRFGASADGGTINRIARELLGS